jgi:hypothetical protein
MKKLVKDTGVITAIIALFIGLVGGICFLVSSLHHDSPDTIYNFAVSAKNLHETIDQTNLLSDLEMLIANINNTPNGDTSKIDSTIRHGILVSRALHESYIVLEFSNDTLSDYELLIKENRQIASCYANLNFAWSARQSGDYTSFITYYEESKRVFAELKTLNLQIKTELDDLQHKAELELVK